MSRRVVILFGNEFDADERAEVNRGLRGGEGDDALLLRKDDGLAVVGREEFLQERRGTYRRLHFSEQDFDAVFV